MSTQGKEGEDGGIAFAVAPSRWGSIGPGSAPGSAAGSPKNKVKFVCSHGGKIILPRPSDGHLKYVGGETRVISVSRDINFPDLMKKLTYLIDVEMVLKYQLIPEDLDALISVRSDEDIRHMLDECDRYENSGSPRLKAFLFPATPIITENQKRSMDPNALEQRYIDAVNGILRPSVSPKLASYNIPSASSSPRSPDSCTTDAVINHETVLLNGGYQNGRSNMHRVHSSPSLCNLNGGQQHNDHHIHHHHYYQDYQHTHPHGYHSSKPPMDPHQVGGGGGGGSPERLITVRSVGRAEGVRYQVDNVPHVYYFTPRHNHGSGCCNKCTQFERSGSSSASPSFPFSPRHGLVGVKAWDNGIPGGQLN